MNTNRRQLITGLISFVAVAPAIVRVASLMPVKAITKLTIQDLYTSTLLDRYIADIVSKICTPPFILHEDGTATPIDQSELYTQLRILNESNRNRR